MSEQGQTLIKAVREVAVRQPDHVFQGQCVYVDNGAPACLIGHALWDIGLIGPATENSSYNDSGVDQVLCELAIEVDGDEGLWLENAQTAQDRNEPWGEAVRIADEFDYSDLERW